MKTNEPSYQNYLVKDGQAVPEIENIFKDCVPSLLTWVNKTFNEFEKWKQSHTYATDAKDGCWPVERFEAPVWQAYQANDTWFDTDYDWSTKNELWLTRQFAKFKEDVEKPKESENPIEIENRLFREALAKISTYAANNLKPKGDNTINDIIDSVRPGIDPNIRIL